MACLALCVVGGPTVGPLIGAAVTVTPRLGWRCALLGHSPVAYHRGYKGLSVP